MKTVRFPIRSTGHSVSDAARCPVCGEPRRFHNAAGSVRAESECTLPYGDPDAPTAPAPTEAAPVAAAPARTAPADEPVAQTTALATPAMRTPLVLLDETPRRPNPRPATDGALDVAVVGGDDADEEVAVSGATGAVTTLTVLGSLGAFVDEMFDTAYYVAPRWYCPSCIDWPLDPGACRQCKAPLQPVYLATVPRSLT